MLATSSSMNNTVRQTPKILSQFETNRTTRGQPATIIPRPAWVIEILQGAYFPEVSHSTVMVYLFITVDDLKSGIL